MCYQILSGRLWGGDGKMECVWEAEDADVFNFQLTEDDMKDTQLMKFYDLVEQEAPPPECHTKVAEHS